ncbi:hypothetical protein Thimo_1008 [Thioflavicoccus mobilis 8321]|uniref:Heparinase II/III-like protein n=1 Tax=Thioflavicoccus mobilis 8321 TaxID=765912 RepID=L0GWZ3_9GAMM|nr:hypothetical protein [Thioflavicoccus mobilis]AGA89829.1 hypothetical protein Thimo_1008 [Thioflavicoccus mobilis 8321]
MADFRAIRGTNGVTFTTSRFGVQARLGGARYAEPKPAADIPGPIRAMRLADGTWFGASTFYGTTAIASWSSELTASGPVFGEVRYRYEYDGGNRLELALRLFAESDRLQVDTDVRHDRRSEGLRVFLSRGLPALTLHVQKLWWSRRNIYADGLRIGDWAALPVADAEPGPLIKVSPWGSWWDDRIAPVVRLGIGDGARELHIARRDPAAWVQPAGPAKHKNLGVAKSRTGEIYIDLNLAAGIAGGARRFDLVDSEPTEAVGWRHRRDRRGRRVGSQIIPYREPLDKVKEYVLDWPRKTPRPGLFMSASEVAASRASPIDDSLLRRLKAQAKQPTGAVPGEGDRAALALWLLTGDREIARETRLVERLAHHLALLGDFDKMRSTVQVAALYDAVIDSDLITPTQRRVLRAQMAYLAYQVAHPATWSNARGWNSGNQNMTVSYALEAPGVLAAALFDHPLAQKWMQSTEEIMESMLDRLGPKGEWPESTGYANLAIGELLTFGILAARTELSDYVDDPRLKRAVTFLMKIRQPPDPRVGGMRDHIRFGRSPGKTRSLDAAMARAVRESDPRLSRQMQWTWLDNLTPESRTLEIDMGGFEYLYLDPSLPVEVPDWGTEVFPHMGIIFRNGLGTDQEHFAALLSGDQPGIYPSQTGGLVSLFAYGRPVAGSFLGGYGDQAEFLINRVSLARDPRAFSPGKTPFYFRGAPYSGSWFDPDRPRAVFEAQEGDGSTNAFSSLPRQDYGMVDVLLKYPHTFRKKKMSPPADLPWPEPLAGEGEPPIWWRRQTLFLKDDEPAGVNYLVMRDSVSGGQPTMWTFWTASEMVGTPAATADRDEMLEAAPGNAITAPRPLEGNRFTALGSWGVDLEYFVAEPTNTPRHTLRWGKHWEVSRPWGTSQYQDLLHLQLEGDGAYYVALFPRKPGTPAPEFETLDGNRIIRVSGTFGTDYAFLSTRRAKAEAKGICFDGTAASIQDRAGEPALTLSAAGNIGYGDYALAAPGAATLRVKHDAFELQLPSAHARSLLILEAPGALRLPESPSGTDLIRLSSNSWLVTVPQNVTKLTISQHPSNPLTKTSATGAVPALPACTCCTNLVPTLHRTDHRRR